MIEKIKMEKNRNQTNQKRKENYEEIFKINHREITRAEKLYILRRNV